MKTYLSPSILSADFAHLGEDIRRCTSDDCGARALY